MLRRILIVAFISWGIVAVPLLCRAGMLEHLCACGIASNCTHEDNCTSDPCAVAKPATEGATFAQTLALAPLPLGLSPVIDFLTLALLDSWVQSSDERYAIPPALRFGARPLLI